MSDITDQEKAVRRIMRKMQGYVDNENWYTGHPAEWLRDLREIFPAPAPTLAEELRKPDISEWSQDGPSVAAFYADHVEISAFYADHVEIMARRAEKMEKDLAEARAEVERLVGHLHTAEHNHAFAAEKWTQMEKERDEARAEVERLTAERTSKESFPVDQGSNYLGKPNSSFKSSLKEPAQNPADVPPGEPWLMRVQDLDAVGVRDGDQDWPWSVAFFGGSVDDATDEAITLISRLVPAPRVITNPDELDKLSRRAVIRDADGVVCERAPLGDGWFSPGNRTDQETYIALPVTVLLEPRA